MSRRVSNSIALFLMVLLASVSYGAESANVLDHAGQQALVLANGPGESSQTPVLVGETTLVIDGDRLVRMSNGEINSLISNGFRYIEGVMTLAVNFNASSVVHSSDLIEQAAAKLTHSESNAYLSTTSALAEACQDQAMSELDLKLLYESWQEIMELFSKPLEFEAADGTRFTTYKAYVEYQWDGIGITFD